MGTHVESISREWKYRYKRKRCQAGKSAWQAKDVMWSEIKVAKYVSHVPRKPLLFYMCPYRKPTQVDEERILRPTGEVLLRNSAHIKK